jgi:hypothetical protein
MVVLMIVRKRRPMNAPVVAQSTIETFKAMAKPGTTGREFLSKGKR